MRRYRVKRFEARVNQSCGFLSSEHVGTTCELAEIATSRVAERVRKYKVRSVLRRVDR